MNFPTSNQHCLIARARAIFNDQPMPMKLLIVDDFEPVRKNLLELLERVPHVEALHTAGTLAQARQVVQEVLPTFVILDFHLPDGNALELIPSLKRVAPGLQIAVLTNNASEFNRGKCLHEGADWVFDKSTEFGNLLEVIRQQAAQP